MTCRDAGKPLSAREHGGIGRRSGLKIRRRQRCGGSSPPAPIPETDCTAVDLTTRLLQARPVRLLGNAPRIA